MDIVELVIKKKKKKKHLNISKNLPTGVVSKKLVGAIETELSICFWRVCEAFKQTRYIKS